MRQAIVTFIALLTTVGLLFLKRVSATTASEEKRRLFYKQIRFPIVTVCTRENVLYASVGIGCGSLRDFAEEDEDRKNACCLILSELNEEKCFCENKIAPILGNRRQTLSVCSLLRTISAMA